MQPKPPSVCTLDGRQRTSCQGFSDMYLRNYKSGKGSLNFILEAQFPKIPSCRPESPSASQVPAEGNISSSSLLEWKVAASFSGFMMREIQDSGTLWRLRPRKQKFAIQKNANVVAYKADIECLYMRSRRSGIDCWSAPRNTTHSGLWIKALRKVMAK